LSRGVEDALKGKDLLLTPAEMKAIKEEFVKKMKEQHDKELKGLAERNLKEGEEFLAANKTKEGVVTTPSGLQYVVIREGDGPKPQPTDRVKVHYRGTFVNGKEFDSSNANPNLKKGEPATFVVNGVIVGWREGLQLMSVGSEYRLFVPADLAYGERGRSPKIPPNATLIFDVELMGIEK
jgi:FKBP-type peptidyl-prolyl cis-trans isomerase